MVEDWRLPVKLMSWFLDFLHLSLITTCFIITRWNTCLIKIYGLPDASCVRSNCSWNCRSEMKCIRHNQPNKTTCCPRAEMLMRKIWSWIHIVHSQSAYRCKLLSSQPNKLFASHYSGLKVGKGNTCFTNAFFLLKHPQRNQRFTKISVLFEFFSFIL